MKYPTYTPELVCPKCTFTTSQMYRQYFEGEHDILMDKEVTRCKVKGAHLHFECCCGYEFIVRPFDWKPTNVKKATKRKVAKSE